MRYWVALLVLVYARPGGAQQQQQLGHKLVGLAPLRAAAQAPPGLYVIDQQLWYDAPQLWDRTGNPLPIAGLELSAVASAVGFGVVYEPIKNLFVSASLGVPLTRLLVNADRLEARLDTFGLSDVFVEPLQIGGRLGPIDLSVSYALYIPTGMLEGGIGLDQLSHQLTLGTALFFDQARTVCASLQAAYTLNQRKFEIDLTRGDTVQIEGSLSVLLWKVLDIGLSGYGLWQVRDDRGSFVPPVLEGRESVIGLGPEMSVMFRSVGAQVRVRYAHDLVGTSHSNGQLLLFGVTFQVKRL